MRALERERPVVLVADNDPDILQLVAFRLERAGYDVVQAADGEEALQAATELEPDLAVLDVMMPKLTGYDVTRRIRETDATQAGPARRPNAGVGSRPGRRRWARRRPPRRVAQDFEPRRPGRLHRHRRAFDLVPLRKALRQRIPTARVRAVHTSRRHPELFVIDKENGGKADSMNCGVNAARFPYVCAIDADAMLEEDALLRVAKPMLDDPDRVAATGIVRIANGCLIEHGRVTAAGLPRSRLATMQVVEYFRAFLVGRVAWSRLHSLLIISGAFGLFRRSLVEAVGGWATNTVGGDLELVVRLHRYLRGRGEEYRIEFVPDPVCWTECPEDLGQSRSSAVGGSVDSPKPCVGIGVCGGTRGMGSSESRPCRISSFSSCSGRCFASGGIHAGVKRAACSRAGVGTGAR